MLDPGSPAHAGIGPGAQQRAVDRNEYLDANPAATLKEAKAAAPAHGWNENNVSCEFYARRKFYGISRQTETK